MSTLLLLVAIAAGFVSAYALNPLRDIRFRRALVGCGAWSCAVCSAASHQLLVDEYDTYRMVIWTILSGAVALALATIGVSARDRIERARLQRLIDLAGDELAVKLQTDARYRLAFRRHRDLLPEELRRDLT